MTCIIDLASCFPERSGFIDGAASPEHGKEHFMRSLLLLVLALGVIGWGLSGATLAQEDSANPPPPPSAGPGGPPSPGVVRLIPPFLRDKLNLTSDQQTKIKALEEETTTKLQAILTADQLKTWKETRPQRPPRGGGGGGGN